MSRGGSRGAEPPHPEGGASQLWRAPRHVRYLLGMVRGEPGSGRQAPPAAEDGRWVATNSDGVVVASAPSSRELISILHDAGAAATGAVARYVPREVGSTR